MEYDAFGAAVSRTGTTNTQAGFAGGWGYQTDTESEYQLLGHRYYDPATGRFLTRDPIRDGSNWYGYCNNNPLTAVDATGLVKIVLYWYEVKWGGYHAGILIIDNANGGTEPIYSFAGGPQQYDLLGALGVSLVSRSGPWQRGTQDYNMARNWRDEQGVVLVDDSSAAQPWIDRFTAAEYAMGSKDILYHIFASGTTGNSNSYTRELLERLGLLDEYERAVGKKGGAPWVPGWKSDPWSRAH
jgi:RHS repeat-associated protein